AADGGAGPIADAAPGPDGGACDPIALLPEAYRPVGSVSSGEVATEVESAAQQIFVTTVDASAGGAEGQAQQPYVYLRFTCDDGPVKVEIDDLAALESTEWDLALERYVIRSNGGDSGPGGRRVAQVAAPELVDDDNPPTDFLADDWSASDCTLVQDEIAGPRTRMSSWYDVEAGRLVPEPLVFYLDAPPLRAEIDVQTYYGDPRDENRSGVYVLRTRIFGCDG